MTTFPYTNNSEEVLGATQKKNYSLDWEPDLAPISSFRDCPEPVNTNPHHLTYTTVGSLVDPKAIFQLAAPNRIQREGANRRPLMSILASCNFDSVFQSSGHPPAQNMSNPKEHAIISQSPSQLEKKISSTQKITPSSTNLSTPSPCHDKFLRIAEQEENFLKTHLNGKLAITSEMENIMNSPLGSDLYQYKEREIVGSDLEGEIAETSIKIQTPIQGLEKMQTLQRLSKFSNPIQEWARNRLSEFAVSKQFTQDATTTSSCFDFRSSNQCQMTDGSRNFTHLDNISLDNRVSMPTEISNSTAIHPRGNGSTLSSNKYTRSSNYTQPLTAGPPGQRHLNVGFNVQGLNCQNPHQTQCRTTICESQLSHQINTPQFQGILYQPECLLPWAGHTSSELVDTITQEDAARYYPYAWPSGPNEMVACHNSISINLLETQRPRDHLKKLDDWFYSGQKRFAMIAAQAPKIRSTDQGNLRSGLHHINTRNSYFHVTEPRKISLIELNQRSLSDCTAPMIDNLFITLLEYINGQRPGPGAILDSYVKDTLSQIETNRQDNADFYDNHMKIT